MQNNLRKTALNILTQIINEKHFIDNAINQTNLKSSEDRAFLNMLILTCFRNMTFLDNCLIKYLDKPIKNKNIEAKYILYLAITEILFLNTPDYAVLDNYVKIISKGKNAFMKNLVNAILRKICEDKEKLKEKAKKSIAVAPWLADEIKKDFGINTFREINKVLYKKAPLDISIKSNPEFWAKKLDGTILPNGSVRINDYGKIIKLKGYDEGMWWVQDFAASLAVSILDDIEGKKVLDICAAPGGKTCQLANKGAKVTAIDISENRLKRLKENITRCGFDNIEIINADALKWIEENQNRKFDLILLDAPCSATGTIRRHPELSHLKDFSDIDNQAKLQEEFLNNIDKILSKNGILIYCTCSISKIEGEAQIKKLLKNSQKFQQIKIKEIEINKLMDYDLCKLINENGEIRTLPHHLSYIGGMDSFFVAKLQKVKD
jgi:16S rRNA (cytosine967-C5)-methyltransferase